MININFQKRLHGFTVTEIAIVLVVLGVIAGLALPIISQQVERQRGQEALQQLDTVKGALANYKSLNGSYTGATFATINYDPNVVGGGQAANFSYALSAVTATSYLVTATPDPAGVYRAGLGAGDNITINETGLPDKNGAYE